MIGGLPQTVEDAESQRRAARALRALGPEAVLLKGGHLAGDQSVDLQCGFPASELTRGERYRRTSHKSMDNPFYIEKGLFDLVASAR